MSESFTIRCNGCGARVDVRHSYVVSDERACSAQCVRRILLRDFNQVTDRLNDPYAPQTPSEPLRSPGSRREEQREETPISGEAVMVVELEVEHFKGDAS